MCCAEEVKHPAMASQDTSQDAASMDPLMQYPMGSYWRLDPGTRLRMMRELCHDALGTAALR